MACIYFNFLAQISFNYTVVWSKPNETMKLYAIKKLIESGKVLLELRWFFNNSDPGAPSLSLFYHSIIHSWGERKVCIVETKLKWLQKYYVNLLLQCFSIKNKNMTFSWNRCNIIFLWWHLLDVFWYLLKDSKGLKSRESKTLDLTWQMSRIFIDWHC